jgi:transcription initiation factor TFIID TATA-box-binding protein
MVLPVTIEDVTAVVDLKRRIAPEKLSPEGGEGYDTEGSEGAVCRIEDPRAVALILPSGKIICTGAKSVQDAEKAMGKVLEKVKGFGVNVPSSPEIEIERIVAAFRMNEGADLEKVASSLKDSRYDPGKFPGVLYRGEDGVDFMIMKGGKIVCSGAKSIKGIRSAVNDLSSRLEKAGLKVELV